MSSFSESQQSQEELDKKEEEEQLKRAAWYCRPEFCICLWATLCAAAILAAIIALALIPVYRRNRNGTTNPTPQQPQDTVSFLLIYAVHTINVTDLMIGNNLELANRLTNKYDIKGVTILNTQLISSTSPEWNSQELAQYNITDCLWNSNITNSILKILFSIPYPTGCISIPCRHDFIEATRQRITQTNRRMSLPLFRTDGTILDTDLNLCSLNQTRANPTIAGTQPTEETTTTSSSLNTNGTGNGSTNRNTTRATRRTTSRTRVTSTTTINTATTATTTATRTSTTRTASTTATRTSTTRTASTTATRTSTTTTNSASTTTGSTTTGSTTTGSTTTSTDAPCPTTCTSEQTCVRGVCVNIGTLGMALTWSRPGDGDIVVATPSGRNIYWQNRGPGSGTDHGFLDQDDQSGTGPENVYWPSTGPDPPTGTYHLCFQPYAFTPPPSVQNPVVATMNVRRPDGTVTTITKTVTQRYPFNNQCTPTSDSYMGSVSYP